MNKNITQVTRRSLPGIVAPDFVSDQEARRVLLSLIFNIQWILDNWPASADAVEAKAPAAPEASATYTFSKSIAESDDDVTLKNDEASPAASKYYGTDDSAVVGYHDLPAGGANHPFKFTRTGNTGGTITPGYVYLDGVKTTITNLPTSLSDVWDPIVYFIVVKLSLRTVTWTSDYAYPAGNADTEIYPILDITSLHSSYTGEQFLQRRFSDIHVTISQRGPDSFSFQFIQTSPTGGTVKAGTCSLNGTLKTIANLPSSLSGVTSSIKYWITVDLTAETAIWNSGSNYATGSATSLIYPILDITCAGSVIVSWVQRLCANIVVASGASVSVDTLTTGTKLAEIDYSLSTGVLRYRSPVITVVDEKLTNIGPFSEWITIDTAVEI